MLNFTNTGLLLSAITTGLAAGLFYSYSCSVNPGLGRLSDAGYLSAMQSINRAILNPVFFASFMGAVIVLPLTAWRCYSTPMNATFYFMVAAGAVYIIGVFGVTMSCNVPLNEALDAMDLDNADAQQLSQYRSSFEAPWNRYHQVRTLAAISSFILVVLGIFKK